jgi:cytochrome d ubiquinol oxidase subunit I
MNHPVGFDLVGGHVTNVRPWAAIFNPFFWHELVHMYIAGYMVVGFVVAGIYAVAWMRGDRRRYVRAAMLIPLTIAALAAPVQVLVGDWAGRTIGTYQPTKLAAVEGLVKTTKGAPFTLGGVYHDREVKYGIRVPHMLSILAKHDPNATIQGLDAVPAQNRPPVNVVRFAFQTMVGIGTLLALFGVVFLVVWWRRRRVPEWRWFAPAVIATGPLALVALIAGWVVTEVGRQPWVVYELMRTREAVTNAGGLPVAFFFLLFVYLTLLGAIVWLLRRLGRRSPEVELARPGPRLPT